MPLTCQLPEPSAVLVPTTALPLYSVIVLLASAVPAMSIELALSCAGAVVVITGAAGATVSTTNAGGGAVAVFRVTVSVVVVCGCVSAGGVGGVRVWGAAPARAGGGAA